VKADVSVSLGLIVTELVINALKHAFPGERAGIITVDYRSSGSDWTLSVIDNGIGMAVGDDAPKPGLGSGIVQALANNLMGEIQVTDAGPGTAVTIAHQEIVERQSNLPPAV
jgi:two-component sensor histidine kinase